MRYSYTPIFQSVYILTIEIYKTTKNFTKEYKYTLGERLKNIAHDMLDLVIKINSLPAVQKQSKLAELDYQKENLRIHLRLALDFKMISMGQSGVLNQKIEELGKQIGGLQKWAANTSSPSAPARVFKT